MADNKKTILCDFAQCPLHTQCAFFCEGFDRERTLHYGAYPYEVMVGRCFEQKEEDD